MQSSVSGSVQSSEAFVTPRFSPSNISFPEELPVSARRDEIATAIAQHQVVIISGETGSGKTTQIPKICLHIGRGIGAGGKGLIGHTQPRRLAATSVAKRIAEELKSPLGADVGYKIRFNDKLERGASIKLMTDGILLAETQSDPLLKAYDTIIIDEAHERSLNIDFLLGHLKQILPRRPDLKVIVTSATIDASRFAEHFASDGRSAPVIEVSGRLYPVEVRWRPIAEGVDWEEALIDAVDEATSIGAGDSLVFLPGEREIRDAAEALRKHAMSSGRTAPMAIVPLFARLSAEEQDRVFTVSNQRRIVLATNVAETSLTVPGIRYVIDLGSARLKRYSYRQKVDQLQIEPISQAAAQQRAGRCGRIAAGVCIRLYGQDDFANRPRFTDPEIMRSSLAAVILRMRALKLSDIEQFPFVQAPPARAIADGYALLQELGALDDLNQLTELGWQLSKLPLDPRVGRMLLAARDNACLTEAAVIAAALSVQDPRERPFGSEAAADQAHRKFADEQSEFNSILKRWRFYDEALAHKKSNAKLREVLKAHFLNPLRMREWRDVHGQLHARLAELGWRFNEALATHEQLHMAILSGLLGNIGCKDNEEAHYNGARGIKFQIFPGSLLQKKAGRWLMAAELVETSKLYARTVAKIEPQWLERVGQHLLRKSWSDPHWDARLGRVVVFERATLYGLQVYHGRQLQYAQIDQAGAREIFIRGALVAAEWSASGVKPLPMPEFLRHNLRLMKEVEQLEHRSRRPDVLVEDEQIFAFYNERLPADLCSTQQLIDWWRSLNQEQQNQLLLTQSDLMRHEAHGVTADVYPKTLSINSIEMPLSYHFEPGSPRDGVTLTVPLYALNQLDECRTEWLVLGMLKEKVQLLMKSLPQKLRRHFVPLPEYADAFVDRHADPARWSGQSLVAALIADMRAQKQVVAQTSDFRPETLPAHLLMNFKIINDEGRQIAMDRSLLTLRSQLGQEARKQFQQLADQQGSPTGSRVRANQPITDWRFERLPEIMEIEIEDGGDHKVLIGHPALVDRGTHCCLEVFDDPVEALAAHQQGLIALFSLHLTEQRKVFEKKIHQWVPQFMEAAIHYGAFGSQEDLKRSIFKRAMELACLAEPLPIDRPSFEKRLQTVKERLILLTQEVGRLSSQILNEFALVQKKLVQIKAFPGPHTDIQQQAAALVNKQFITAHPYDRLTQLPRYLRAIVLRIEKLRDDPQRDTHQLAEIQPLIVDYQRKVKALKGQPSTKLDEFRWLLEELRVSVFAQELRTSTPVSVKRLQKLWDSMW